MYFLSFKPTNYAFEGAENASNYQIFYLIFLSLSELMSVEIHET